MDYTQEIFCEDCKRFLFREGEKDHKYRLLAPPKAEWRCVNGEFVCMKCYERRMSCQSCMQ